MVKARTQREADEGSAAREEQVNENPVFVKNMIMSMVQRAAQGDRESAKALDEWLARHPDMRKFIRQLDDLCTTVEEAWVGNLVGNDLVREKGVKTEIARMKDELLAENSSLLDRLMVSNAIVAYLANQSALLMASKPTDHLSVATARARQAESTARRLLYAMKGLSLIREKMKDGLAPRTKHRLFDASA